MGRVLRRKGKKIYQEFEEEKSGENVYLKLQDVEDEA